MNPPEYDYMLIMIEKIPEKWDKNNKTIPFKIITSKKETKWVTSRIFEEVDRNLISVGIQANSSKYSIELDIMITVVGGLIAKKAIDIMLEELKDYLKNKWRIKRNKNKMHY